MALQILRYGALALVSACLVMIALVVGGLVPLQTVRDTMAKVPALVQVIAEEPVAVAKVDPAPTKGEPAKIDSNESDRAESGEIKAAAPETPKTETAKQEKTKPGAADPESDKTDKTETAKSTKDVTETQVAKVDPVEIKPVQNEAPSENSNATSLPKQDGSAATESEENTQAPEKTVDPDNQKTDDIQTASDDLSIPTFDVLRVEPDGSIVMAGKAKPGSTVELRMGDGTVVGSGKAGPSGDFVILPDNPLKAGNHLLSLVVTGEDGSETISAETATVSVPDGQNGDVLALISKEGQASRIIAKPETLQSDAAETASAPKEEIAEVENAGAETDKEVATATDQQKDEPGQEDSAVVEQEDTNAVAKSDSETPKEEQKTAALTPRSEDSKQDDTGQTGASEAEIEKDPQKQAPNDPSSETESAAVVRVEAVEIEQDQVFIAGAATQGSTVRLYINNRLVGETRGTSDNRFLVTRNFTLEPGRHTVRADSIDNATGKVLARAEVPLLHELVVEVAKESDEQTQERESDVAKADVGRKPVDADEDAVETKPTDAKEPVQQEEAAKPKPEIARAETSKAGQSDIKPKEQPEAASRPVEVAKADDNNVDSSQTSAAETANSDDSGRATRSNAEKASSKPGVAESSPSVGQDSAEETAVAESDKPASTDSADIVTKDAVDKTEETPASELKVVEAEVVESPKVEPEDKGVKKPVEVAAVETAEEVEGAPDGVIRTGTSIIIKKGDTLWRISRQTYGRGIRYTTIYEANRDQIKNPHRIYIGQIFKIPDRPSEELVEADG